MDAVSALRMGVVESAGAGRNPASAWKDLWQTHMENGPQGYPRLFCWGIPEDRFV
jgi:hypothetical protein